jgi:hypothetical protein
MYYSGEDLARRRGNGHGSMNDHSTSLAPSDRHQIERLFLFA